jgi:hypothetical protein
MPKEVVTTAKSVSDSALPGVSAQDREILWVDRRRAMG